MYSIQLQQVINLFLLVLLGYFTANFHLTLLAMVTVLTVSIVWEHFLIYCSERKITYFSFSSMTTALGVMLMVVTSHLWITMFLIVLGLLQKHFLTWKGSHFFNPSNFALMMGLLFFYHDAHIVLGQLGDSIWLLYLAAVLGASILYRVARWIIPVSFSLFYLLFQYLFIVESDPVLIMEDIVYRFYSVSFMVFVLFMLTDPKTTPKNGRQQLFFAFAIALFSTVLDYIHGFRVQHLFMALFAVSPLVLLMLKPREVLNEKKLILLSGILLLLALGAIIYIENQPPYYFEMD